MYNRCISRFLNVAWDEEGGKEFGSEKRACVTLSSGMWLARDATSAPRLWMAVAIFRDAGPL